MDDELKKLIASFLEIWDSTLFEKALLNYQYILKHPQYPKRRTQYNIENWDFKKFLEKISTFLDIKQAFQKVLWISFLPKRENETLRLMKEEGKIPKNFEFET